MNDVIGTYADDLSALSVIYCLESASTTTLEAYTRFTYLIESGEYTDIVTEAGGDIITSIINGIKKLIEHIKDFFKRILLYLKAMFGDITDVSSQLKDRLNKMPDIKFTISGFNFTVLDKSGPDMSEFKDIINTYNDDMANIAKLKITDVKQEINDWLGPDHMDKVRGKVLGTNDAILDDDFSEEVRAYYRGDEKHPIDIKVDKPMVTSIINHAKKLADTRDSAIKDRDNLITLLTKTEEFFQKTIYPTYKGTIKLINTDVVDVSDNKFSTTGRTVSVTDQQAKDISVYATLKSRQVNKIGAIVTTVACERANALKDQVKQEKTILRKCLFDYKDGYTSQTASTESIHGNLGINNVDYVTVVEQNCINTAGLYDTVQISAWIDEAKLLLESANVGEVHYLMEADTTKASGKVKEAILDVIAKIIKVFREKAMRDRKKYEPWINDVYGKHKAELLEKAKQHDGLKMYEFWKTKPKGDGAALARAITSAYGTNDFTTVAFAEPYLKGMVIDGKNISKLEVNHLNNTEIRTPLLNYFRVGDSNVEIKPVTANGSTLASQLGGMCNYILKYDDIVGVLTTIQNSLKGAMNKIKITESTITGSTYLGLIQKPICESTLTLCRDYKAIFGSPMKSIMEEVVTGGNTTSGPERRAVNANIKGAEEAKQSVTAVKDMGEEAKEKAGVSGIKEEKTNTDKAAYKKAIDHFFRIAIAAYEQAREEQFIAYLNAISEIAGARPKFDKDGNYIPVKWGEASEGDKTEGSSDGAEEVEPAKK